MFTLYTAATPNGYKISIALEELELEYNVKQLDFEIQEQKEPWFLELNPNGRIPVLLDHDAGDYVIWESGAILQYLAEKYGKLCPTDTKQRFEVLQWLFFQVAGVGPMQGQAHVFTFYAPEKIPYAISRYQNEAYRLYKILDERLDGREYLCGEYSIADTATFPWARSYLKNGFEMEGLERVAAWIKRIDERPAVQRGLDVPVPQAELEARTQEEQKNVGKQILGEAESTQE